VTVSGAETVNKALKQTLYCGDRLNSAGVLECRHIGGLLSGQIAEKNRTAKQKTAYGPARINGAHVT